MNPVRFEDRQVPRAKPLCPMCQSDQVSTTSKSVTEATYWRCHACGEIWNQSRLRPFKPRRW
ncbi:MAG: hypothetical protein HYU37_03920 [Acidobacteria bacterium]|nr:hypothetical protein [Acidobacteriota bacterium]